jgi:large subunit ribosomal protein L10
MARPEKVAVVEEIRTKLAEADATVLTEYRGLTVHELAELRASLRGAGTEYKVFKNTLARRAVADSGLDDVASMFEGPVAIAFVRGDAAGAAKALRDFGRNNPALVLKGGLLGARIITAAEIEALAELPSRDALLAQVAGVFQAPLTKAAGLFQAFTRNFAYGVQALIDQRGGVPEEPAPEEAPADEAAPAEAPADEAPSDAPEAEAPAAEAPAAEPPAAEATEAEPETAPEPEASSDAEAPAADETAPEPESAESE